MANRNENSFKINLAKEFSPHGYHRDMGAKNGAELYAFLFEKRRKDGITVFHIDLNDMKTFNSSFADGAFGRFIDELGENFHKHFIIDANNRPVFKKVMSKLYELHRSRDFNRNL